MANSKEANCWLARAAVLLPQLKSNGPCSGCREGLEALVEGGMSGFSEADWEGSRWKLSPSRSGRRCTALDRAGHRERPRVMGRAGATGPALAKMRELNPHVPVEYLDQARAAIIQPSSQDAIAENYRLHQILVGGYRGISYIDNDGIEQNSDHPTGQPPPR